MTNHRASSILPVLIAGVLCFGLSGCRSSENTHDLFSSDSDSPDTSGAVKISKMGGDIDVKEAPHGAEMCIRDS